MCTQSIEWNLLLFGLLHSNVSNFYSRYWVWFTHDWHFILLNMCSHCGFNVLLNIFSWAYSTFFAVCCIHFDVLQCIPTTFTAARCFQLRKKVLRLDATSYQSSDRTVQRLCLWLQTEHERQFCEEFAPHPGGRIDSFR